MLPHLNCIALAASLGFLLLYGFIDAKLLWFEQAPSTEDPCVITVTDSKPNAWKNIHPDPTCEKGGLIWYGLWGGVRLHFYSDVRKKENFKVCLTGGEPNTVFIYYDYLGNYINPIVFPTAQYDPTENDRCRRSVNGTMDVYIRGMKKRFHYFSFLTWEIEPSELDQTYYEKDHKKRTTERKERERKEREGKERQENETKLDEI